MTRTIVLAVLVAGLALVLFAERLGIPAGLASRLVLSLLGAAVVLTSVLCATSRLPIFLAGEGGEGWLSLSFRHAVLLAGGVLVFAASSPVTMWGILIVICAYLAAAALCPGHVIEIKTRSPTPQALRLDESLLLTLAIGLIAAAGVLALGPEVIRLVGGVLADPFVQMPGLPLALTAILLLSGGNRVVLRLASMGLTLAILFIFLPFLLEIIREAAEWRSIWQDPLQRAGWQALLPDFTVGATDVPLPALIGLALGLVGAAGHAPVDRRLKRCLSPVFGVVVLCLTIILVAAALLMLERMLNLSFAGIHPQRWPLFAFEESLRGWISVCGKAPVDALDVVEACRKVGLELPVGRGDLKVDPELRAPVIAAARGLPAMLGVIWLGVGLLVLLILQMLLLSTTATAFSEVVLFRLLHPRGLKAWRLVAVRVSILALASGAFLFQRANLVRADLLAFLALGAILLVGLVLVAHYLRRIVGWSNARLITCWPAPANENTATGIETLPSGVVKE